MLRTILAVILGVVVGSIVNMGLIILGPTVISAPAGVDVSNAESIAASIHLFQPKHFVFPFLAHALGTFVGALVAFIAAVRNRQAITYALGVIFLAGGISASFMIPAPTWFIVLDLLVAYIPMSWLALQAGRRLILQGEDR